MNEIKKTGGARIGMMNASWPFATLKASKNKLELNVTIFGNLVFTSQDITSVEPYGSIPFLRKGIKINHKVKSYKSNVIFWTVDDPKELIKEIKEIGFLDNPLPVPKDLQLEIDQKQKRGGFPIKTQAAILIVIIWNLLFVIDLIKLPREGLRSSALGVGTQLAIGFVLITSILLLTSKFVRKLILKEGHKIDDIRKFIYFLIFICGFLFINISITN
ncbi:MAG TPA: hypothetical protein PLO25_03660 [Candidatus Saccharibacteria bacterium]|nr:hypothetical protein [Candidatus Competibacteraceae bacterium]MCP5134415.1 hypothetical protein [Gammaproteobacteria bacterium]HPF31368.1 hypothetical protein [Candidatus Saccharibacteria bacterium]